MRLINETKIDSRLTLVVLHGIALHANWNWRTHSGILCRWFWMHFTCVSRQIYPCHTLLSLELKRCNQEGIVAVVFLIRITAKGRSCPCAKLANLSEPMKLQVHLSAECRFPLFTHHCILTHVLLQEPGLCVHSAWRAVNDRLPHVIIINWFTINTNVLDLRVGAISAICRCCNWAAG